MGSATWSNDWVRTIGLDYPGDVNRALIGGVLLLGACGRFGFDRGDDAPADGGGDATEGAAFDPVIGNCIDADRGPFVEAASIPTQGSGYGVWAAKPFVLVADTTGGLRSVRFDGTAFTQTDRLPDLGWTEAVWNDGAHFWVGSPGYGLTILDLDSAGKFTIRAQDLAVLTEARRGWFANDLTFVPSGNQGLHALRFDGAAIVRVGTGASSLSWAQGVWAKGSRVYFADADRFRVLDFDGSTFTDVITPDARHGSTSRIWSDGTTIFVASADGLTAFRLTGTNLVELDTFATTASARDVWSDGQHLFVAAEADGVYALSFENDAFTLIDRVDTGGGALGVFGDGTYLYANDYASGLHAYRGFACRTVRSGS